MFPREQEIRSIRLSRGVKTGQVNEGQDPPPIPEVGVGGEALNEYTTPEHERKEAEATTVFSYVAPGHGLGRVNDLEVLNANELNLKFALPLYTPHINNNDLNLYVLASDRYLEDYGSVQIHPSVKIKEVLPIDDLAKEALHNTHLDDDMLHTLSYKTFSRPSPSSIYSYNTSYWETDSRITNPNSDYPQTHYEPILRSRRVSRLTF